MKKIKTSTILFENEITLEEIPRFRAAIADKAGKENKLFHHHIDENKTLYRYPLIQFKSINNQPFILCLEEGTDGINKFLTEKDWTLKIGEKKVQLKVEQFQLKYRTLQLWDKFLTYRINHWIALNEQNYETFFNTNSLVERINLLERTLIAHILSFAEGVKWNVDKKIHLFINDIHKQSWIKYKTVKFLTFDITFSTNVSLPEYVGLGKLVSVGFGVVNKQKQSNKMFNKIILENYDSRE